MIYEPRICIICKKKYTPVHVKQKCCSRKCSQINMRMNFKNWWNDNRILVEHEEKECLWCGKLFKPKNSMQTFCSKRCNQKYNYHKHKQKNNSPAFRSVVVPPNFKSWYHGHDILDEVDETDIPVHQRRNSILMSIDPYPV